MKTLTITDLAHTNELDRDAMATVRGGYSGYSACPTMPSYPSKSFCPSYRSAGSSSISATQDLTQLQSVVNATANGSAFIDEFCCRCFSGPSTRDTRGAPQRLVH